MNIWWLGATAVRNWDSLLRIWWDFHTRTWWPTGWRCHLTSLNFVPALCAEEWNSGYNWKFADRDGQITGSTPQMYHTIELSQRICDPALTETVCHEHGDFMDTRTESKSFHGLPNDHLWNVMVSPGAESVKSIVTPTIPEKKEIFFWKNECHITHSSELVRLHF